MARLFFSLSAPALAFYFNTLSCRPLKCVFATGFFNSCISFSDLSSRFLPPCDATLSLFQPNRISFLLGFTSGSEICVCPCKSGVCARARPVCILLLCFYILLRLIFYFPVFYGSLPLPSRFVSTVPLLPCAHSLIRWQ